MKRVAAIAVGAALSFMGGCQQACPPAPPPVAASPDALPAFVGKVWVTTTPGKARGSILVFLPDKTVLIDSCFEGFRVAEWGVISENRIRWREDTVPIEAEYSQSSPDVLQLKPVGTSEPDSYVRAAVPYVCPDMPK
jgi:hypothetical protein